MNGINAHKLRAARCRQERNFPIDFNLELAAADFRRIYIWHPYEHHRNSVWLILQWKRAAEMVCHLLWSVAKKAQAYLQSALGQLLESASTINDWELTATKGHRYPGACGFRHTRAGPSEGEDGGEYKAMWLGRKPPAVCTSPLPLPPSLVPFSNPGPDFLLGWFPLFVMFPLYHWLCFLPEIDPESGMDGINIDHVLLEGKPNIPWSMTFLSWIWHLTKRWIIGHRDGCREGWSKGTCSHSNPGSLIDMFFDLTSPWEREGGNLLPMPLKGRRKGYLQSWKPPADHLAGPPVHSLSQRSLILRPAVELTWICLPKRVHFCSKDFMGCKITLYSQVSSFGSEKSSGFMSQMFAGSSAFPCQIAEWSSTARLHTANPLPFQSPCEGKEQIFSL